MYFGMLLPFFDFPIVHTIYTHSSRFCRRSDTKKVVPREERGRRHNTPYLSMISNLCTIDSMSWGALLVHVDLVHGSSEMDAAEEEDSVWEAFDERALFWGSLAFCQICKLIQQLGQDGHSRFILWSFANDVTRHSIVSELGVWCTIVMWYTSLIIHQPAKPSSSWYKNVISDQMPPHFQPNQHLHPSLYYSTQ